MSPSHGVVLRCDGLRFKRKNARREKNAIGLLRRLRQYLLRPRREGRKHLIRGRLARRSCQEKSNVKEIEE
jgi:hypothetical protein